MAPEFEKPAFPRESGFFIFQVAMKIPVLRLTRLSLFTALGVTLGYALMAVPNVELITATAFIAGAVSGAWGGAFVGGASEGIFSLFHPLGAPPPPLWAAQVLSMALTGAAGGLFSGSAFPMTRSRRILVGISGFLCTLNFAVLTTLAYSWTVSFSLKQILASLVFGLGFYVVHLTSNTAIFFTVVPAVLKILNSTTLLTESQLQGKPQ
jgi:hypothetical protein